jgi:hypothetical protein
MSTYRAIIFIRFIVHYEYGKDDPDAEDLGRQ